MNSVVLKLLRGSAGASVRYSMFYLLGLALPYVHFMFLIWVVFEIFTPIMGRSGTEIPPEVVLASLVTLATIFLSSFFVSIPIIQVFFVLLWDYWDLCAAIICFSSQLHFIYLVRSTKWILTGLGSVFLITFLLISSGLLFPYSGSPERPRPKRVFLQVGDHTGCPVASRWERNKRWCFRPPCCSTPLGPSTISRARWRAGTRVCGSTASTTRAYSTSPPTSPRSTTAFAPTAARTGPSAGTPGSCP